MDFAPEPAEAAEITAYIAAMEMKGLRSPR